MDARSKARLPVTLIAVRPEAKPYNAVTANVGLGGAFINYPLPLPEATDVRLKALLPDASEIDAAGKIVRKDENGVAVKFVAMDSGIKSKLWLHIREGISRETHCPYCGGERPPQTEKCPSCGLSVNFQNSLYLDLHERELRERWVRFVESAGDEFVARLEAVEKAVEQGGEDPERTMGEIEAALAEFVLKAERFEQGVGDPGAVEKARLRFREKTERILSRSYFLNRTRVWPQGYQGDYKTLEGLYRNIPLSTGVGLYLDMLFLKVPLAVAVRNRIMKLEEILRAELLRRNGPSVLNIACGSCRELVGLASEIEASRAKVTCIDSDDDALAFAYNRLARSGVTPRLEFRNYNALRLFDEELNAREFGPRDIIYSVGLFDYLESDFLTKMLGALYRLLNPGGVLIAAFKDADRYVPQPYHWPVDWDGFKQRGEREFREILTKAGVPDASISEVREETGIVVFYLITR
ncbi:MAG: hypothetical protein Kow0025_22850 [Thermodesulfovibrionales bacterium]